MNRKILIANSHIPWGGLGIYTINLARVLAKNGYQVFGLITHSNDESFEEFIHYTNRTFYAGTYNKIVKYIKCVNFIRSLKPDYIIVNYLATIHFLLPFIRNSKIISVIHSDLYDFYRVSAINKTFVDRWITPSSKVHDGFVGYAKLNTKTNRIQIIPHGIDVSNFVRKNINTGTFNIVYTGALYKHKGVDLIPEIFSRFRSCCPDSRLTIIGEGELYESLHKSFENNGLTEFVKFTGLVRNNEVRSNLQKMDVLLFPTRLESFGISIVEAMMEGVVPLVTKLDGITDEIIKDSESGFLIGLDDIERFVEKLILLYNDRSLMAKMSIASQTKSKNEFSLEIMGKRYSEVIDSIYSKE